MTAVGLGQQGSQAVGSGFESLPCQNFLRFILNMFRYPKLMKHERVPLRKIWALRQKISTENLDTPPPLIQIFSIPKIIATVKDSPTEIFGTVRPKIFDGKSSYPPPPSYPNFSVPEINETLKDSPLRKFSAL